MSEVIPTRSLVELDARFLKIDEPGKRYSYVDSLEAAQGVDLLCPSCFHRLGGARGCHRLHLWFKGRGVSDDELPGKGRWTPGGTGVGDLHFVPDGTPHSVLINGHMHGFIEHGKFRVDATY